jgi:hypothetical protein
MMADAKDNSLNRLIENPLAYAVGAVLVVVGVAMGWLDGWYGLILLGVAAFGAYRWFQKRKPSA